MGRCKKEFEFTEYQKKLIITSCSMRSELAVDDEVKKLAEGMKCSESDIRMVLEDPFSESSNFDFIDTVPDILKDLREKTEKGRSKAERLRIIDYLIENLS